MFNFPSNTGLPGFRVGIPEDEPGFRMMPDGSIRQNAEPVPTTNPRNFAPDGWSLLSPDWSKNSSEAYFGGGAGTDTPLPIPIAPPGVEPVAAGDLKCDACAGGRPSGMTGAYREGRDILCAKCIVKRLGYEDVPSSELPSLLRRWSLDAK